MYNESLYEETKNHSIKVRMTEEEMAYHLKQAASYTSMSHYVRSALKEYSHPDLKLQHELIPQIGEFYQKYTTSCPGLAAI